MRGLELGLALLLLSGCHSLLPSPFWPHPSDAEAAASIPTEVPAQRPLGPEWSAPPAVIERALRAPFEVLSAERVEHGQTKTAKLGLYSPSEDLHFEVKWKAAKPSLQGVNNSPRREIAAYHVQQLVLTPEEYVVPTTLLLCLPPNALAGRSLGVPNLEGAKCVVGAVSLWLQDVRYPKKRIDWERFRTEPTYAYHAANLNVVGILMDHSDTHTRNMLVSSGDERRMFLIDNGIAFNSSFRSPFSRDWNRLRVPALRRATIDRLRTLERKDLDRLLVVGELRHQGGGLYAPADPEKVLDGAVNEPVRKGPGVLQLGLKRSEVDAIWARRNRLLELVDRDLVRVF